MGNQVSRRYKYGLRPKKYFNNKILPEMKETFGILDFTYKDAFELFKAFIEIDFDNSGEITVLEFHKFLGMKPTKFSERVFGILDLDESGELDFNEFVIGIWNFSTYDPLLITKFAFDIFDIDNLGKLQIAECEALVRMVYNESEADPELIRKIDVDGDGEITIDEFANLIKKQPQILQPAFDMQRCLRNKCFGVKYWELATEKRREYFANYDSLASSSWESVQKILLIREKEREEASRREQELFVAEATERLNEHKEHKEEEFRERQLRRDATLARINAKELPEERAEREMWDDFKESKANFEADCPADRLTWKIDERQLMWDLIDKLRVVHATTIEALEARDLTMAMGPDGDAKAGVYLVSKAGTNKLKYDATYVYATSIKKRWVKGNALQRSLAPMLQTEVDGQVTALAKVVHRYSCGNKKELASAAADAKASTIEHFHREEKKLCLDKYYEARGQGDKDFKELGQELVETFGTRNTRWEELYNPDEPDPNKQHYHYNWRTGNVGYNNPAVCEACDELIDSLDFKCFGCNTLRSRVNQGKYKGRTPLKDLMEVAHLEVKENDVDLFAKSRAEDAAGGHGEEDDDEGEGGEGSVLKRMARKSRKTLERKMRKSVTGGGIKSMMSKKIMSFAGVANE